MAKFLYKHKPFFLFDGHCKSCKVVYIVKNRVFTRFKRQAAMLRKSACIEDYILSLPLKYNTLIGQDGVGLSQGQKQRILIARAVYKNPDYIFLDEATNALDRTTNAPS